MWGPAIILSGFAARGGGDFRVTGSPAAGKLPPRCHQTASGRVMADSILGPRKRRTREHIIADLSVHHFEGFALRAGHVVQRVDSDYGYDLFLFTFDEEGYAEPGVVSIQLKAVASLRAIGSDFVFDLDVRDYNLWMSEEAPVVLVLFDVSRNRAYWLWIQGYFDSDTTRRPKPGAKFVRVRLPVQQIVNRRAIAVMRGLKWAVNRRVFRGPS